MFVVVNQGKMLALLHVSTLWWNALEGKKKVAGQVVFVLFFGWEKLKNGQQELHYHQIV